MIETGYVGPPTTGFSIRTKHDGPDICEGESPQEAIDKAKKLGIEEIDMIICPTIGGVFSKLKENRIVLDGNMITTSGIIVDLFNPNPDSILIEDIAHGLANNCRWNGHTAKFYSVAQHCCLLCDQAEKKDKLPLLFHDAEEAYWGDMIKPLKNMIAKRYPEIIKLMEELRLVIFKKFNIPPLNKSHHDADHAMLYWELENVVGRYKADLFWSPEIAEEEWMKRYKSISNE